MPHGAEEGGPDVWVRQKDRMLILKDVTSSSRARTLFTSMPEGVADILSDAG